jgi:hypothetical protein
LESEDLLSAAEAELNEPIRSIAVAPRAATALMAFEFLLKDIISPFGTGKFPVVTMEPLG